MQSNEETKGYENNRQAAAAASDEVLRNATSSEYKYGFTSDIDTEIAPPGLTEETIRFISHVKGEPEWLLEFRLRAFRYWLTLTPPSWAHLHIPPIDFQAISYYAAPKKKELKNSMDEVDPELVATFNKLGISLEEQKQLAGVAVDAVMDSVSVKTTHREKLAELGVIFCSFSEAVKDYPDLVRRYLGSVVSYRDNYFAALNSAVFSDGSFVYIPKGVRCPMELSTYFRINASGTGQFERTLI
ncbi:MAG: Fe-S cluster assembly protein SufB, partial [Muribaculaceae bacterium]|nr:Fe-S cluster assembly protein SufB [Muribaculaceae bacterium]